MLIILSTELNTSYDDNNLQLPWNVVPPELIVELTQVEVVEQNTTAAAYLEESCEFGVNSMKKQVTRILMELQPAVYDSGDFGREISHGIANGYVLVKNKNKLMKFVLQIIKTPQNIFKNFHFKFLNFFYIPVPISDKRIHEPRKDSLEQPSRITQLKSETLEYLGDNVTMSCTLLKKKKKCWSKST